MITEELSTYISNLRYKEENGERYYYSVYGEKQSENGSMLNIPIVNIKQSRKQATGADKLQDYFDRVIDGKYDAITIEEYPNCSDNATPIQSMRFVLANPKGKGKKKPNQNQMSKPSAYKPNSVDTLDNLFKQMGVPMGLQGFMQATAQSISTQERYEDAKQLVSDLKSDCKLKDTEIQRLKDENEKLRYQIKDEKDKVRDIQHECEIKIAETKQQVGFLGLAGQFAGAFFSKTGMGQKLAGFMADGAPSPTPSQSMGGGDLREVSDETLQLYQNVEQYYRSLGEADFQIFASIVQYLSMAPANLPNVGNICKKLYQTQLNRQSNGVQQDTQL